MLARETALDQCIDVMIATSEAIGALFGPCSRATSAHEPKPIWLPLDAAIEKMASGCGDARVMLEWCTRGHICTSLFLSDVQMGTEDEASGCTSRIQSGFRIEVPATRTTRTTTTMMYDAAKAMRMRYFVICGRSELVQVWVAGWQGAGVGVHCGCRCKCRCGCRCKCGWPGVRTGLVDHMHRSRETLRADLDSAEHAVTPDP